MDSFLDQSLWLMQLSYTGRSKKNRNDICLQDVIHALCVMNTFRQEPLSARTVRATSSCQSKPEVEHLEQDTEMFDLSIRIA